MAEVNKKRSCGVRFANATYFLRKRVQESRLLAEAEDEIDVFFIFFTKFNSLLL